MAGLGDLASVSMRPSMRYKTSKLHLLLKLYETSGLLFKETILVIRFVLIPGTRKP